MRVAHEYVPQESLLYDSTSNFICGVPRVETYKTFPLVPKNIAGAALQPSGVGIQEI